MESSDKSNGQVENEIKSLNIRVDKLTVRVDDLSSRVAKLEGKNTDTRTTEKPYDADPMLNSVLNESGLYEKLNNIRKTYFHRELKGYWYLLIAAIVILVLLTIGYFFGNSLKKYTLLIEIVCLLIAMSIPLITQCIFSKRHSEDRLGAKILRENEEIIGILRNNKRKYNFDYLSDLLQKRVEEKRARNESFKNGVTFAGSISGIGFIYVILLIIENKAIRDSMLMFIGIVIIVFVIGIFYAKVNSLIINGEDSIFKWERLADDVNLVKYELEAAENSQTNQSVQLSSNAE